MSLIISLTEPLVSRLSDLASLPRAALCSVHKNSHDYIVFLMIAQVHKLMNKVEELYAKHFTDGERKKAISHLRPERKIGSHRTTFFIGMNIESFQVARFGIG